MVEHIKFCRLNFSAALVTYLDTISSIKLKSRIGFPKDLEVTICFLEIGAFLSVIPATLFIVIWAGSRLTKEGRELHLEWHAFGDALQKNRLNIKEFDPDLLLQYCIVMGVQAKQLKSILNQVGQGDGAYLWYVGDSGISSVSAITDIAATGTSISAVYSGGGAGGGAGGGGGGGAG